LASIVEPSDTMAELKKEGKTKATVSPKSSAPVKVSKSAPIIVKKRDLSPRAIGLEILARSYLGEMDLEMAKRRALRYENRNISDEEAVLALLTELLRNSEDMQQKAKIMENIAEYQSSIGEDPRPVLKEMHKLELNIFKEIGFERVSISSRKDACAHCKKQDGKVLSLEEALGAMPLPHPECTKLSHSRARPFCRCRFYGEYIG
jgi:hypothetical protein